MSMNLRKLLGLCEHKWKLMEHWDMVDEYGDKTGHKYILKCEKCGDIKRERV